MKNLGFVSVSMSFSSSLQAWPETCTSAIRSYITFAPCWYSWFITLPTLFSLPGMDEAEIITISPLPTFTLWEELAILNRPLMGSP